jgi:hypothetical protein
VNYLDYTPGDFANALFGRFGNRVVSSWLQEFGYAIRDDGLLLAVMERAARLHRELDAHAKRLADRAQMQRAPQGRASVIR